MIIKNINKNKVMSTSNRQSGHDAEVQMALYLEHAFKDSQDILVLNDLRIIYDDYTTQVDHMIITKYGLIFIETKNVYTRMIINEYDEWSKEILPREPNIKIIGIPSPEIQVKRQREKILKFLENKKQTIFKRWFSRGFSFKRFQTDILVAISDNTVIERANNEVGKHTFKSDRIIEEINKIIEKHKENCSLEKSFWKPFKNVLFSITNDEAHKIAKLLVSMNRPKK